MLTCQDDSLFLDAVDDACALKLPLLQVDMQNKNLPE